MSIREQIIYSGMLMKSPPQLKHVDDSTGFKKWENRFFELVYLRDEKLHILRYYTDESKAKLKKFFSLAEDTETKLITNIESKSFENVFCIVSPKRRFFMSAQSARTANKWYTELATACPHLANITPTNSISESLNTSSRRTSSSDQVSSYTSSSDNNVEDDEIPNYEVVEPIKKDLEGNQSYDTLESLADKEEMYVDMRSPTSADYNELTYTNWEIHKENESNKAFPDNKDSGDLLWNGKPEESNNPSRKVKKATSMYETSDYKDNAMQHQRLSMQNVNSALPLTPKKGTDPADDYTPIKTLIEDGSEMYSAMDHANKKCINPDEGQSVANEICKSKSADTERNSQYKDGYVNLGLINKKVKAKINHPAYVNLPKPD